jgi:hypothetical protein
MMLMGFFIKIPALNADIPRLMRPAAMQLETFSVKNTGSAGALFHRRAATLRWGQAQTQPLF